VLESPVGSPRDVQLGYTLGLPRDDAADVERHAEVQGLGLQEPPCELSQSGCLGLGRVQDDVHVHVGTLTRAPAFQRHQVQLGCVSAVQIAYSVLVFDTRLVNQDRSGADSDRVLVAEITEEARHRARWGPLTEEEEAAALAELRALAGGRADLLAQVAGIFEGTSEGEPDEPLARSAARLCRLAGADVGAIPAWTEEGRRRSTNARRPPFSGGLP